MKLEDLHVQLYADGAVISDMVKAKETGMIKGFTTNPSLMKKAGITNYVEFAQEVLDKVTGLPISFEVFADDFPTMKKEAEKLSSLGDNVFVKIPITNTKGESSIPLIHELSEEGIQVNVTAIFTVEQVKETVNALKPGSVNIISVFAGRLADIGIDPEPIMKECAEICHANGGKNLLLWASCREVFNVFAADRDGCDIITCTQSTIDKFPLIGESPEQRSLETVRGFNADVQKLAFSIL